MVRVITPKPWKREEFFRWLEGAPGEPGALTKAKIAHVGALAEAAGISPSTISKWRNNKQRPTVDKLTALAVVLGVARRDVLLIAGLLDEADMSTVAPASDNQELSADERRAVALIQGSNLSDAQKKRLIADHLDGLRRAREEVERQTRSTIALLEQD